MGEPRRNQPEVFRKSILAAVSIPSAQEIPAKYLDAENGGTTNGTNVIQYENNGALNQRWYIKDAGDGSYNIVSNSGLYITADGRVESGTNLKLYRRKRSYTAAFSVCESGGAFLR